MEQQNEAAMLKEIERLEDINDSNFIKIHVLLDQIKEIRIKRLLDSGLLFKLKWHTNYVNADTFSLTYNTLGKDTSNLNLIYDVFGSNMYHETVYLTSDIVLVLDDYEIHLNIGTPAFKAYMSLVDFSSLDQQINNLKKSLKTLTDLKDMLDNLEES